MTDPPQGHPERKLRASLPMFAQDGDADRIAIFWRESATL